MRWPREVGVVEVMVGLGVVCHVGDWAGNWVGWDGCHSYKNHNPTL